MLRWWGKIFSEAPSRGERPLAPTQTTTAALGEKSFAPTTSITPVLQTPRATLFCGNVSERLFTLTVQMFGHPSAATIQDFFQRSVPELVALVRSKPLLIKELASHCEKMPVPYGAFVGIACGANAIPEAQSGLRELTADEESTALASLKRIYPFNPKAAETLIEQLGSQGSLANRLRVLELLVSSRVGNRHSMNQALEGIAQASSADELNAWVFTRLLALVSRPAPSDQQLAFKQGWLASCVKGWLGEELHDGRLSALNAAAYKNRFDPRA